MNAPPSDRTRQKERAALVSLAVKIALTLGKVAAAALSGSLALVSEAGNNLGDIVVTLLSFYAIRISAKPADDDHQFGHGKIEALSALIQTGFLFALALFILAEAVRRLVFGGVDVEPDWFAFAVLTISIVVDSARWRSLNRIAKATRSASLAADALNFATDIVASVLALGGLAAALYGFRLGDTLAAIAVAVFVGVAGFRLGRETVGTLIDAAPKGLAAPIRDVIESVPGVIEADRLRLRPIGSEVLGEVIIKVSRTLALERVEVIKQNVIDAIGRSHPDAMILVTAEPIALDDETVVERVLLTAHRRRIPVHHVTVQTLEDGRQSVSFDAELTGSMPLGRAHEVVTALEDAIAAELGSGFEVECHIEPLEADELAGIESDEPTRKRIEVALIEKTGEDGALSDVHDVRVRQTRNGLVVNYHCLVDPTMSVDLVHTRVDTIERQIRAEHGGIRRIVGHAEPLKRR